MLLSQEVEVKVVGRNMRYYEELGYEIPKYFNKKENKYCVKRGTTITVKIKDIPKQSHVMVDAKCDYCGEIIKVRYDAYNKQRENDIINDCCNDCKVNKGIELNLLRYGVGNQFQREEIKNKTIKTNVKKYGYYHPAKNPKIKAKIINTMSRNGNIETSRQQLYIHRVIGGELNYNDNTTGYYSLDIAFPNDNILIEYDGSGHDLQVKFGNMSKREFKNKEIIRSTILRRNGWKEITIISKKDFLPNEYKLRQIINEAKDYFNNGRSWITYDIDENKVFCSEFEKEYNFGELRKITESDLNKNIKNVV